MNTMSFSPQWFTFGWGVGGITIKQLIISRFTFAPNLLLHIHSWWIYKNNNYMVIWLKWTSDHKLNGSQLVIIVVWNLLFISSYGINMDFINLLVLFEHGYRVHCLNMNVICLFILFKHGCCMSTCVVYIRKLYTRLSCLNNAQHSC